MTDAVIVATSRTPIGRARKGSLVDVRPEDLLVTAIEAALSQVPELDRHEIDDLMVGCARPQDEQGGNIARRAAVMLGLDDVPGTTVNRFCSSSLQTTRMAFHAIRAGEGDAFVSAGVECVSRYLHRDSSQPEAAQAHPDFDEALKRTARTQQTNQTWRDPRESGDLPDVYIAMGQTAENVATFCGISRREQDEYAERSQRLTDAAVRSGFFAAEITPVAVGGTVIDSDDCPRPGTTLDGLSGLQPVFREHGTVTAGNCCPLNDGAAAVVVMSDRKARELGLEPLARILSTGVSALSPEIMGLGPVEASRRALARAGLAIGDIDLVEINEAFASQVIASYRAMDLDPDRLNVHGGAIALGHPFGMTGARITTTLINGLRARDAQFGLETMCVAGGQGMAMIIERLG